MRIVHCLLIGGLLFFLVLPVFLVLRFDPAVLKPGLEEFLGRRLSVETRLGKMSFHPDLQSFELTMTPLVLLDASDEEREILRARRAFLSVSPAGILRPRLRVQDIRLEKADVFFEKERLESWKWLFQRKDERGRERASPSSVPAIFRLSEPGIWDPRVPVLHLSQTNVFCGETRLCFEDAEILWAREYGEESWQVDFLGVSPLEGTRWVATGLYDGTYLHLKFSDDAQSVMFEGGVIDPGTHPRIEGVLDLMGKDAAEAFDKAGLPAGIVSGSVFGQFRIATGRWRDFPDPGALIVQGVTDIRGGHLEEVNFLKQILERVLSFHGYTAEDAWQVIEAPQRGLLTAKRFPFEILQAEVEIADAAMHLLHLQLKHKDYFMEMSGRQGLETGEVDFTGRLVVFERLSAMLTEAFPELTTLLNPRGRLVFLFSYAGLFPDAVVQPDMEGVYHPPPPAKSHEPMTDNIEEDEDIDWFELLKNL